MDYNPQLVSFLSTDALRLPGLLYKPTHKTSTVALYLHGNGSSSVFYNSREMNAIATRLNHEGIAFFPFNNRGAHYIKSLKHAVNGVEERVYMGTTYELIKDCIADIDGALHFLKTHSFTRFYVIGISTGANKIVVYNKYKPQNEVRGYVLLSGGDDTGLYYQQMGKDTFFNALHRARKEIEAGNGRKLVPKYIVNYPFSWQSLYDTINPDGDYNIFPYNEYMNHLGLSSKSLFGELKAIQKSTLVVYGEFDEYCYGDVPRCVDILKTEISSTNFTYSIIPDADHGFNTKEQELAD